MDLLHMKRMFRKRKVQILLTFTVMFSLICFVFVYTHVTSRRSAPVLHYRIVNMSCPTHLQRTIDSDIYRHRTKVANDACFKHGHRGQAQRVFLDQFNKMAYCVVPKVGCTYWINILRFLNNDTYGMVFESPHDIPRIITHYSSFSRNVSVYSDEPGPSELSNKLRFMFVRDPYSRLWSAWIDKFWLPDFWFTEGANIANFFNLTEAEKECPTNISFVQFLTYISRDKFLQEPNLLNEHWAPYRFLCDPCVFRPHVIGKMETFHADTSTILEAVNLTWVLETPSMMRDNRSGNARPIDRSVQEMSMLTYYNMELFTFLSSLLNSTDENCFNQRLVYKRLWAAFQYNGHLPFNVQFPEQLETGASIAPEDFLQICKETFFSWSKDKNLFADHKKAAMIEAYRPVPNDVMNRLLELYESDFEMFEYNRKPIDLYHYR
ncbi:carbohydrate sulfotransferase 11-like [Biomphalaria glabrata]|uniref:Carbohydrate sulfotransferase n=1 Tax=Biomphalaria glabrata TaxID=6526 RepID=A0A9W2Z774_BIOGL|nr:carbohydrate sulfotransferase 11-like [Biomphalaria glabrata]